MPRHTDRPTQTDQDHKTNPHAGVDAQALIDDYAVERVEYHVGCITRSYRLNHHDREDLRQNFFVQLCEAARRFDPEKSSRRTFVSRVLSRAAAHHARCIRNERRSSARSPIRLSELQHSGGSFSPTAPRWCSPTAVDLAIDLGRGIAAMSRRHQQVSESLKTQTAAEVAVDRRAHRSTIYRDIAAICETLAEFGLDPSAS